MYDVIFKNGNVVDVKNEQILQADIAVKDGKIAGIGHFSGENVIDCTGKYITPGFIDAHVHIESSMATPMEFSKAVMPHGTTTVIADPHELVNVKGNEAMEYILDAAGDAPLGIYVMMPSSIPATPFETNGADFTAEDMKQWKDHPLVLGLGEVMCYPAVLSKEEQIMKKLELCKGMVIDGHAPGLSGEDLKAYVEAGVMTDHECTSFEEAKEALSYRKMSQDGDVIYMEDIDKSEQVILLFDEKAQDKLFTAVKFGKEEDIHAVIRKMKEYLIKADMSSSSYQAYSMSVINALLVFARQQDLEIEEVFDGIPNYLEIMQKYASADTFMEWLEEQCIRLNANQGRERENKAKGIIEEAKQKIQEEFGDPDIGLEKIAAEVGLTQTYFSSLFKKETGMSFVEYLTDTRMKEAMRLLKETSEKIYVVAQKVGYLESGYFSHVFKKKYGMSPIQCRRQGQ